MNPSTARRAIAALALLVTAPLTAHIAAAQPAGFIVRDGDLVDPARDREVGYRAYIPAGYDPAGPADLRLILVSHGGTGSPSGENSGEHLGERFAQAGYLAVHIGHRPSAPGSSQLTDRPADVSFILDALEARAIDLPPGFAPRVNTAAAGHLGHSYGAYTAHAVAGAQFDHGSYRDPRIAAIVALSPQGAGQFGAFDNAFNDSTWTTVEVPACSILGADEADTNVIGTINEPGWRLTPFERYPLTIDSFLAVIPNADHSDLWSTGSPKIEQFTAENSLAFFDTYLRDRRNRRSLIGNILPIPGTLTRSKTLDLTNDTLFTFADISAFLNAFVIGADAADVAPPFGRLTFADIAAFATTFPSD